MTVNSYIFQSPSSSQVQVGRLDTSVNQGSSSSSAGLDTTSKSLQDAKSFQASQKSEVKVTIQNEQLLDVYA